MGYKRTSGTIRAFSLAGVSYTPMADANFSRKPSQYENEGLATSGTNIIKKTKIVQTLESVTIGADELEVINLARIADSDEVVSCSYKDAAGNTHRNPQVTINIESHETETNTVTLMVIPVDVWPEASLA